MSKREIKKPGEREGAQKLPARTKETKPGIYPLAQPGGDAIGSQPEKIDRKRHHTKEEDPG